jgi:hypothetical protein
MRLSRPSTGTILGGVALFVALGGTALAATGTVVNIADPTTPANVAKVDATGALKTAGTDTVSGFIGETIPKTPFFGHQYLTQSTTNTLIGANKATVALTRIQVANYFAQNAAADIRVYQRSGTATTCDGSTGAATVGAYELYAGQSQADAIGSPIVLKPLVNGDVWCLVAITAIQGSPGSYYLPDVSFSGYVTSGTLPAGSVPRAKTTHAVRQVAG